MKTHLKMFQIIFLSRCFFRREGYITICNVGDQNWQVPEFMKPDSYTTFFRLQGWLCFGTQKPMHFYYILNLRDQNLNEILRLYIANGQMIICF